MLFTPRRLWLFTLLYVLATFGAAPIPLGELAEKVPDAIGDGGASALFMSGFLGLALAPLFAPLALVLTTPPVAIRVLISLLWLPSLLILIMSGPGMTHIFLYIFVTWAALIGLWAQRSRMGQALLLTVTFISLWSLGTMALAASQIIAKTQGAPYCVARSGAPIHSIAELRGLAFYTDETGFKSTSRWTFHGVLLTENQAWNWSPQRLRFDPIPEPVFPDTRRPECPLESHFLRRHIF
ncbi:hypothetical protein CEW89_09180 [Celeribacter ethanolicus]|uniref:Uncharacterized protein n=1 Tax=Celeribacter ethanolicus TaxID=1758178 RepID=A0A291GB08_9RHOB|nr:hypothetical protein [Celeribacter ethanolicus]ATG47723.1 hypothetical protein CEW89_09180 [Celeribacter ethanolicus]